MEAYGFNSEDSDEKSMASNLLKIQVYFASLNVETITEDPRYEVKYIT